MNLLERAAGGLRSEALFDDAALLSAMLRFEASLARCQAEAGLIPAHSASAIEQAVLDFSVDTRHLGERGAHAGSLAIAFVQALRAHVARRDAPAAAVLHRGSTSQDVLDTAMALCTRDAVNVLLRHTDAAIAAGARLARAHRDIPMLARTLMQAAGITTFGFKAAQWTRALAQCRQRLANTARTALAVSLAGATGQLDGLGAHGAAVRAALARALDLHDPGGSWHTLRHAWVALACDVGLLCGTQAKVAQDIALLAQSEVGEVEEPVAEGRGGSSALPHKRNPVLALQVLTQTQPIPGWVANLLAALPQTHERALGAWQSELAQWPGLFRQACAGAQALEELLAGLVVHPRHCARNIANLHGVIFAERVADLLAMPLGRTDAQALIQRLCREALHSQTSLEPLLESAVLADPRLATIDRAALRACFDVQDAARGAARQVEELLDAAAPA